MATNYTIIQYVPDPVIGERVNIGVAAYSGGIVKISWLRNWQRVKALHGKDTLTPDQAGKLFQGIKEEILREHIKSWDESIQFTEPSTSLQPIDDTLQVAVKRFLVEPSVAERPYRTNSDVRSYATGSVRAAVARRINSRAAKNYVRPNAKIAGRFGVDRRFDLVIGNGRPVRAVQALSLAGVRSPERNVEAVSFLAEEIQRKLPLTVVVAPPSGNRQLYHDAVNTLNALGALVVDEDDFGDEATAIAEALELSLR